MGTIDREGSVLLKTTDESSANLDEQQNAPPRTGLVRAAMSFAASMARFAASGFKTVDESLHELRMGQCGACEYRRESQCVLCRCFVSKKAWLPHEDCPVGRWES